SSQQPSQINARAWQQKHSDLANKIIMKGCGHDPNGGVCAACQKKAELLERIRQSKQIDAKPLAFEEEKAQNLAVYQAKAGCGHDPNGGVCAACQKKAELLERIKASVKKEPEVVLATGGELKTTAREYSEKQARWLERADKENFERANGEWERQDMRNVVASEKIVFSGEDLHNGYGVELRVQESTLFSRLAGQAIKNSRLANEASDSRQKKELRLEKAKYGKASADAKASLKSLVIGGYSYEQILNIAWLRKMYGHLIGLQDLESKQNRSAKTAQSIRKNQESMEKRKEKQEHGKDDWKKAEKIGKEGLFEKLEKKHMKKEENGWEKRQKCAQKEKSAIAQSKKKKKEENAKNEIASEPAKLQNYRTKKIGLENKLKAAKHLKEELFLSGNENKAEIKLILKEALGTLGFDGKKKRFVAQRLLLLRRKLLRQLVAYGTWKGKLAKRQIARILRALALIDALILIGGEK
ncbi:MAG: hypothetical protein QW275_02295, partial [Candidatus Anstonellaceae archaeon]